MSRKTEIMKGETILNPSLLETTYKAEGALDKIKNKSLRADVKKYIDSETKTFKGQWDMVKAIARMDARKDDDFATLDDLAGFLELSTSYVSRARNLGQLDGTLESLGFTVSNAYEFLKLRKTPEEIAKVIDDYNLTSKSTQQEIREAVKARVAELKAIGTSKVSTSKESEEAEGGNDSLKNYSDEVEEELFTEYTLPIWTDNDGGFVDERTVSLSESAVEELSKVIRDWWERSKRVW